jgi:hypothetical protein
MSRSRAKTELSAAQLAARRANARLSTGPRSPEGKAIAALNSVSHGLCSNAAVLPGENVEEFQATLDGWVHELKPADAFERELVYNMVCASIAITRVRTADNAAVSARVRAAGETWDDARAAGLKALVGALGENKTEAHEALLRRGDGCRWLLARWRELDAMLEGGGYWNFKERDFAIRLLGVHSGALRHGTVRLVHGLGMALEAAMKLDKEQGTRLEQEELRPGGRRRPRPARGVARDHRRRARGAGVAAADAGEVRRGGSGVGDRGVVRGHERRRRAAAPLPPGPPAQPAAALGELAGEQEGQAGAAMVRRRGESGRGAGSRGRVPGHPAGGRGAYSERTEE